MTAVYMMLAVLIALSRVASIVMLGRLAAQPDRYTWVQGLLIVTLAVMSFLPISVGR
jgi:uncharacterized membrane protein